MSVGIDGPRPDGAAAVVRWLLSSVAVVATVPPALVGLDGPWVPASDLAVPPGLALVLAGVGLTAVGVWRLVALAAGAAAVLGLLGATVLLAEGVAIGTELKPIAVGGLVYGAAGGAVAAAGCLGVLVRWRCRSRGRAPAPSNLRGRLVGAGAVVALLAVTRASVPAWLAVVGVVGIVLVGLPRLIGRLRAGIPAPSLAPAGPTAKPAGDEAALAEADPYATLEVEPSLPNRAVPRRTTLRVLHLGLADPGRTATTAAAELNRRLAAQGHEIIVVSPRSAGMRDRVEHHGPGRVHWTHPGWGRGRTRLGRLLVYAAAAIVAARHVEVDLVVEELAAPLGSLAVPRWAPRPVVAVAAWLPSPVPADRWAPLPHLRWWAVRTHRSVIARSRTAADVLAAAGSRADVALVGDGIDPAALRIAPCRRGDDVVVVPIGHMAIDSGPLALLVHAWAQAAPQLTGQLVLLDSGPHEGELRRCVARLGLAQRVEFAEEPDGEPRHARVASARLAAVPPGAPEAAARTAALEALAVGTPVLGPNTAALREVVPPAVGVLVPPTGQYDSDAATLAHALRSLHADQQRSAAATAQGPGLAHGHTRDVLAGQIEDVYLAAVAQGPRPHRPGRALRRDRLVRQ